MSEEQKMIVEIAARFMEAKIAKEGFSRDLAHADNCVALASRIVGRASKIPNPT